jgi:EF-P beta-lysylation protein EpmB
MPAPEYTPDWQQQLAGAVRSGAELLRLLAIDPGQLAIPDHGFPLRVPHAFVARMRPGDRNDPLLRQVLPVDAESNPADGFSTDPLAELDAMPVPGLLHKYQGRALLTVTGACAVHCRYCFRRHFPYGAANPAGEHWPAAIAWLREHADIEELILSGGDPLSLTDQRLRSLTERLRQVPQLRILRIHTRMPVVLPARVDAGLLDWLEWLPWQVVIVVHCNHAQELDANVQGALRALAGAGVTLLNQSVLLRGVNDAVDTLVDLSHALFAAGVLPYYLHQLDRVQGAAHFAVSDARALQLLREVRAALPGYLVPRLVREHPGADSKTPLG